MSLRLLATASGWCRSGVLTSSLKLRFQFTYPLLQTCRWDCLYFAEVILQASKDLYQPNALGLMGVAFQPHVHGIDQRRGKRKHAREGRPPIAEGVLAYHGRTGEDWKNDSANARKPPEWGQSVEPTPVG